MCAMEAARALGLCDRTVRDAVKRGLLPAHRMGGRQSKLRIAAAEVRRYALILARAKARRAKRRRPKPAETHS